MKSFLFESTTIPLDDRTPNIRINDKNPFQFCEISCWQNFLLNKAQLQLIPFYARELEFLCRALISSQGFICFRFSWVTQNQWQTLARDLVSVNTDTSSNKDVFPVDCIKGRSVSAQSLRETLEIFLFQIAMMLLGVKIIAVRRTRLWREKPVRPGLLKNRTPIASSLIRKHCKV